MQNSLFNEESLTVVDDNTARIFYWPCRVSVVRAEAWLEWLIAHVSWRSDRRMMYEREVDVPRLRANFNLDRGDNVPDIVLRAVEVVDAVAAAPYNSVGLNYYRDGSDSVAPHNDRLSDLVRDKPIALLSLGGPRQMVITSKTNARKPIRLSLESGSVLVMDHASQRHYLHGLPKVASADRRISLAFRVRPVANGGHPASTS